MIEMPRDRAKFFLLRSQERPHGTLLQTMLAATLPDQVQHATDHASVGPSDFALTLSLFRIGKTKDRVG